MTEGEDVFPCRSASTIGTGSLLVGTVSAVGEPRAGGSVVNEGVVVENVVGEGVVDEGVLDEGVAVGIVSAL